MAEQRRRSPRRNPKGRGAKGSANERRAAEPGVAARRLAIDALLRIDTDGAYANLALPPMLERSTLEARDRGLVTELVYGTTRMRRALDFIVDRFLLDDIGPEVRAPSASAPTNSITSIPLLMLRSAPPWAQHGDGARAWSTPCFAR
ncbi:MAG: transcription antitermination factor NusB [Acidimicrobiales bacterium]